MRRVLQIALAAAICAAATDASAQFRETPMILYAPAYVADVLPYASDAVAPANLDLLTLYRDPAASTVPYLPYRKHHDMLARLASPAAQPAPRYDCVAAGRLAQNGADALTDVLYCVGSTQVLVAYGNAPGALSSYAITLNAGGIGGPDVSTAHLLPRDADLVAIPLATGNGIDPGFVVVWEFSSSGASSVAVPAVPHQRRSVPQREEVWTMRVGSAALALGLDDLYLPGQANLQVFENRTPTGATALGQVVLGTPQGPTQQLLPVVLRPQSSVLPGDCEGAAPLDVNADGVLDLVVSLSLPAPPYSLGNGHLYWIRGRGAGPAPDLLQMVSEPWTDMNPVLGLVDPFLVRPLVIGGQPAVAVWDRGLDAILVIRSVGGTLTVWRGSAAGRRVRDIWLADLVGSSAPDLVVDGTGVFEWNNPNPASPAVLVYPDVGDASPVLAWSPGSPGVLERGEDHAMAVLATDSDTPPGMLRVEWTIGDPWLGPIVATGPDYVHPGASMCGIPPQELEVTVRAVDELGVFAEIGADLDVSETPPKVSISGAVPPDRLALPPGGTAFAIDGSAWSKCAVTFAWNVSPPWPAGVNVSTTSGAGTAVQSVALPETVYPDLLAGAAPAVTLTATDSSLTDSTTLQLYLDATSLVDVAHSSDIATIRQGEVAVLETRIASRLAVEMPSVHVVHALAGLVAAGEPEAIGATVVATLSGGTEVVLDRLPPAGNEVVVRLPVHSSGGRAASAVEVRSSGGHLLTPATAVPVEASPMPGCGCGSSPGGSELALAALAALRRRARPRLATRRGSPLT